ncbi:TetR/AcrR family transcriptional regulator [Streptomyces sp. UH6]|uniref:TetR/AcrR family transcriptional regulator n=1 Tax=Streptomyces sp. UH6 TaxID=2748379 RepID=UPI0015D4D2D7|nr:TetR/AcrR family transcriptional regulator [Streptomyces sp. UH6]NYV73406.1 TetR/AcrR family transcriptional regulator [Streptomyces sp. UH6]
MTARRYHHGDLRRVALAATAEAIEEGGSPAALSLRDVARRAGVSHAAFTHHFGSKPGLLTALATEGYTLLADALGTAGDDRVEAGVAYVRFAAGHPAHFKVMFQPGLYHPDDPGLRAAEQRAGQALRAVLPDSADENARRAAWSIVHGFAGLWLSGALPAVPGVDAGDAARPVISLLTLAP